jgi:hypothetical protein
MGKLSLSAPWHYKQSGAFHGLTVWTDCQCVQFVKVLNQTHWATRHYRQSVGMNNLSVLPTCTNEEAVSVATCRFGHPVRIGNPTKRAIWQLAQVDALAP